MNFQPNRLPRLFRIVVGTGFAAVLALSVCELALRILGFQVARDPYLAFGIVPPFFEEFRSNGESKYRITHPDVYRTRNVQFRAKKAPGAFRVFCFGGSASAGWPHPEREIYSAYLQQALERAYPNRPIEIINAGAHAYAAYRVRLIYEQASKFDMDAIVVYSGNNEFLERRSYDTSKHWYDGLGESANAIETFRLVRASRLGSVLAAGTTLSAAERQYRAYSDWSKIEGLALELRKDLVQFQGVKDHYRFSIESIVTQAQSRGIPVVLLTVPVNLRDWEPNVSYHELAGAELEHWQQQYEAGRRSLQANALDAAVASLSAATQISPTHAESHFRLARALEARGQHAQAYGEYSLARDFDYNPFRAHSEFNAILGAISQRHSNVILTDAADALRLDSAPRTPGFDYFLDYVHPTKRGNLLIAKAAYNAIVQHIFGAKPEGALEFHVPDSGYNEATDYGIHNTMLLLCHMMHQHECALNLAERLADTGGAQLNAYQAHVVQGTLALIPELLEQERLRFAGEPVPMERAARLRADIQRFYRQTFSGYDVFQKEKAERLAAK